MKITKKARNVRMERKSVRNRKIDDSLKKFFPPTSRMGIPTHTTWGNSSQRSRVSDRRSELLDSPDLSM
jgi:hypothetical protein